MRRTLAYSLLLALVLAGSSAGQEYFGQRDFLTEHEIDLIREAQEPEYRIPAYLEFAALRLELVRQLLLKEEPGRGGKINRNLKEYGRILEAIDMVVDDALVRDKLLDEETLITPMIEREREFLASLKKIQEADPDDLWRFEFVLEDALEITQDSLEMTEGDLVVRKEEILEADDAERAAREKSMTDARRADVRKAREKAAVAQEKSRGPSLLKEGETLETANDPSLLDEPSDEDGDQKKRRKK